MSLFSNAKNSKLYYPPIGKVRHNNNIHLTDINSLKGLKIKKNININTQITPKKIYRNLHLNKSSSYNNIPIQNKNKTSEIYTQELTDSSFILNLKNRNNSKKDNKNIYLDSESLYENNILLKREINKLKKELMQIKAENQRKENEINKRDKLLETAIEGSDEENIIINNILLNGNNTLGKNIKKNNYISKFKKQYSELKNKYNEKIQELNNLKKSIKTSKLNELIIQNKETIKEFNKLKELYMNLYEENKNNLEKLKVLTELENNLNNKNLIILQLQEKLKLSSANNIKSENEIEKLNKTVNNLQYENKRLNNKLKTLYEYNNRNMMLKGDNKNYDFILNEELSLHPQKIQKIKNGISYNNTNRSFLNISNKINLYKHKNNNNNEKNEKRKSLNISPLSKKYINSPKDLNNNKKNSINENNDINNIISNENEKNINNEEKNSNSEENIEEISNFNNISQTLYILIKNFEVLKITRDDSLTLIIKPILNEISDEKQIKNETLVNIFTTKIGENINCINNKNDITSISNMLNSLLNESNNELFSFIKSFLDIFDNVKIYDDNIEEEKKKVKKINELLLKYKDYFINSCNDKYISFFNFRKLLNEKDIILDDEDIEYLIYKMKKDCINISSENKINKDETNQNNIKQENIDINKNKNEKNDSNVEHNYSMFDLNYKTFLNMIK